MLKDLLYLVAPNPVGMVCLFVIVATVMFLVMRPTDD